MRVMRLPPARCAEGIRAPLIVAPASDPWTGIASSWNNTLHLPSTAGTGLSAVELGDVISIIAGSV
jgi:hypothetical protein